MEKVYSLTMDMFTIEPAFKLASIDYFMTSWDNLQELFRRAFSEKEKYITSTRKYILFLMNYLDFVIENPER